MGRIHMIAQGVEVEAAVIGLGAAAGVASATWTRPRTATGTSPTTAALGHLHVDARPQKKN